MDIVQGLIDTAQGYLATARQPTTSDSDAFELTRDASGLGDNAYRLLEELEGAGADEIPHPVVRPFQRWVTGLGVNDSIFFRSDHVANYELATFNGLLNSLNSLNSPSQSLVDAIAAINWPFRRVTVPSQAMGMLPHFAIVAHELGHAIQDRNNLDFNSHSAAIVDCAQRTEARLQAEGLDFDTNRQLHWRDALHSWIHEIWSDAVGGYLAGPSMLFALGALFEITGGGVGLSATHPPHILRLQLLVDSLEAEIDGDTHSAVFEAITGTPITARMNCPHVAELPDQDTLYSDLRNQLGAGENAILEAAIAVELVPLIQTIAGDIRAEARAILEASNPEMIYQPAHLKDDLNHHLEAICALIPPIEHRGPDGAEPSTLAGVLNVGWAALLCKLQEFPDTSRPAGYDETAAKMEKLQELLLKAVELSEARRQWEEVQ
ncbi:MAG: hypothetical protein KDB22_28700 [Planctomycetales bacterium]|nr:hypothetical protein [Planctomycetales bacterium]